MPFGQHMQVAHGWTGVEFGMAVHARAGRCEFGCEIAGEVSDIDDSKKVLVSPVSPVFS